MKQWLIMALAPMALAAGWKWVQANGPERTAGLLVKGIIKLEALLIAHYPALAAHRKEANQAIEAALRETADDLQKQDDAQP